MEVPEFLKLAEEEAIDEVIQHAQSPDLIDNFQKLKAEHRQRVEEDRRHFKNAERYLRRRKAPPARNSINSGQSGKSTSARCRTTSPRA